MLGLVVQVQLQPTLDRGRGGPAGVGSADSDVMVPSRRVADGPRLPCGLQLVRQAADALLHRAACGGPRRFVAENRGGSSEGLPGCRVC